jgi:D-alanyl-D-alanine carboxypeptidase/D-alanyl-D-alanine-endopeptidase (penicillin-binding protein 4)
MSIKNICLFSLVLILFNCKSVRISKAISKKITTNFYDNQFTGLLVYNPRTKDTIYSYNAHRYFTPASNTKLFTLYAALHLLPEKIPAFKYAVNKDTITIKGTGNPLFLHPFFNDSLALKMAQKYKSVNLILNNLSDEKFGPGWAWEDYDTYFNPERTAFPMYGNVITVNSNDSVQSIPKILDTDVSYKSTKFRRHYHKNQFFYNDEEQQTIEIPLAIDSLLTLKLWNTILPNKVRITKISPKDMMTAYSIASDSLYKRMMHVSDNFLAEQMLILASSTLSDTLDSEKVRDLILKQQLKDLKERPRWVDGSGLSRYNLFSPRSFVQILTKLYSEIPRKRLFNFFPVGGQSGTVKKWYAGVSKPYIYAKSGSLSNNYSLSGYLITNSGETLIFSFMNNHFKQPIENVKEHMQTVFEFLRDNY